MPNAEYVDIIELYSFLIYLNIQKKYLYETKNIILILFLYKDFEDIKVPNRRYLKNYFLENILQPISAKISRKEWIHL